MRLGVSEIPEDAVMRAYTDVRLGMDHDDAEGGGEAGGKQGREGRGACWV